VSRQPTIEDRTFRRFFFSSRRQHTRFSRDWSSDVCSSDLEERWGQRGLPGGTPASLLADTLAAVAPADAGAMAQARERQERLTKIGRASCREGEELPEVAGGI